MLRLLPTPLVSRSGFCEDGVSDELRERGVKNRLNFRGVTEGFRLSLLVDVPPCGACIEEGLSGKGSSWDGGGVFLSKELAADIVLYGICRDKMASL